MRSPNPLALQKKEKRKNDEEIEKSRLFIYLYP